MITQYYLKSLKIFLCLLSLIYKSKTHCIIVSTKYYSFLDSLFDNIPNQFFTGCQINYKIITKYTNILTLSSTKSI